MGRGSKALAIALGAAAGLAGLVALALYGYGRGWYLSRVPPQELAALLRPHDEVLLPEGEGPFAAVIQFHGCGGNGSQQRDWAQVLRDAGFAAVIVDSFAGRGATPEAVCGGRALLPAERAGDVLVSLDHVRRLPFVDPERVVLMGWSHGAVTLITLLAMNPPEEIPPNLERGTQLGLEGVAGVVLVYPYCGVGSRSGVWASRVPTLFLVAGADTVAAPGPCTALAGALSGAGRPAELHVYPGVNHAFDHRELDESTGLVFDVEATADAVERVRRFLARITERATR